MEMWLWEAQGGAQGEGRDKMTRRERLERKVEKRREWADGREQKAAAVDSQTPDSLRHDWAFITQPGRIPERSRMNRRDAKASEHRSMAAHHRSRAGGLEKQLERTVFSDDTDAIEKLEARIAENEHTRDGMKEVNALYRKGDAAGLEKLGLSLATLKAKLATANSWEKAPYPKWSLTNLGARIRTDKKRIEEVRARVQRAGAAEEAGGVLIEKREDINWAKVTFAEKPAREVLNALRVAGFQWSSGSWHGNLDKLPSSALSCASERSWR